MINLNGTKAAKETAIFIKRSATAKLTQSGATNPKPSNGSISPAQETSVLALIQIKVAEKATVKNTVVSTIEPINEEINGGKYQFSFLNLLKTKISVS